MKTRLYNFNIKGRLKINIIFFICLLSILFFGVNVKAANYNDSNLVSIYLFDNTNNLGADYKGTNSMTTAYSRSPSQNDPAQSSDIPAGFTGVSIDLDGNDSFCTTSTTTFNPSQDHTLCFWVKPNVFTGEAFAQFTNYDSWILSRGTYKWATKNLTSTSFSNLELSLGSAVGNWIHVCNRYDSPTTKNVYINGILIGTQNVDGIKSSTKAWCIGSYGVSGFINGKVFQPIWFNRTLTEEEINKIYLNTFFQEESQGVSLCGDNIIDGTEICDGTALNSQTCITQGFTSGTLNCNSNCLGFDTSLCSSFVPCIDNDGDSYNQSANGCGISDCNDIYGSINPGMVEICNDGIDNDCNNLIDCEDSACSSDLNCVVATCGNNLIDGTEICDGTALNSQTCITQGFTSGTLSCNSSCSGFNTNECISNPTCNKCTDCDTLFGSCSEQNCHQNCNSETGCYYRGDILFFEDCVSVVDECPSIEQCSDYSQYECNNDPCNKGCQYTGSECVNKTSLTTLIVDHNAVEQYDNIPPYWINEVKKMWINIPGESHSSGYRIGLGLLQELNSSYPTNITDGVSPTPYTESALRINRAVRSQYNSWASGIGEDSWYTWNAWNLSDPSYPTAKANIIKNHLNYSNTNNLNISAIGFGWCWDMTWHNGVGGENDTVYGTRWAGASAGGPNGDLRWGLNDEDNLLTNNTVNMDDYLQATQQYIDYVKLQGFDTTVLFTTGPVDGNCGSELGYQRDIKQQYIRNYVNNNGGVLFDYADILTYNNTNLQYNCSWNGHSYPNMNPANMMDYVNNTAGDFDTLISSTEDGDHIGEVGALRLGKATWWMLARLAGWDGNSSQSTPVCMDSDGDYYNQSATGCGVSDCNDIYGSINPGMVEICNDGIDNDCNNLIDCEDASCSNYSSCILYPDTYYISSIGSGNKNGSDWNNAYEGIPLSLDRGSTYYIAEGNYSDYTFDDVDLDSEYIFIKKATINEHGTNVGWQNDSGDGQIIFSSLTFETSKYVLDFMSP
jgi:hypothetical protein